MTRSPDVRREFWQCIRMWLFDYSFTSTVNPPRTDVLQWGFTALVTHAFSHWKDWVKRNRRESVFTAHYKRKVKDDVSGEYVRLPIQPDQGEHEWTDYLLLESIDGNKNAICAVESECGKKIIHIAEDFPKLLKLDCSLKVMIYRSPKTKPATASILYAERRGEMERLIAEYRAAESHANWNHKEWLFIGVPWYRDDWWPTQINEVEVWVHTLSPSGEFTEPEWGIWDPAPEMDQCFRSLVL